MDRDLWNREYDSRYAELREAGLGDWAAFHFASNHADQAVADKESAIADAAVDAAKEG